MKKRYTYNRLSGTDIVVNESMRGVLEKLNWTCASTQEANPTPDAPKPIYSSGDGGAISVWSHKKNMLDTLNDSLSLFSLTIDSRGANQVTLKTNSGVVTSFGYFRKYFFAGTYKIQRQFSVISGTSSSNTGQLIVMNDALATEYAKITPAQTNATFTITTDGYYRILLYSNQNSNTVDTLKVSFYNMQLELGSTSTSYEPYTGSTTDIILPTGYVGGSLPNGVADSDTQKKIGKITLVGTEGPWTPNVQATYVEFVKNGLINPQANSGYIYCFSTHFLSTHNTTSRFLTNGPQALIRVPIVYGITTSDQFNTWLASQATAGTPVTAYYQLATPVDITITKPPVSTYEGINYITTTNNIKPSLTIEAWKK